MKLSQIQQLKARGLVKKIAIFAASRKIKIYLVGGILRDAILSRQKDNPDIDFCLKRGAIAFAREASAKIKAGFVVLDKAHGCARLVKKIKNKAYTLDFSDFRGKTIEEDLLHRDFSINSLAMEARKALAAGGFEDALIDPCNGRKDLKAKIVRMVNKKSFDEDPLRIMRAFSLACIFVFKIDTKTLRLACRKRNKLRQVSGERIRDELFKIFSCPHSFEFIKKLDQHRILEVVFPEIKTMRNLRQGAYHHLDIWGHSLETLKHLEDILKSSLADKEINGYLNQEVSSGRRRYELLKLAALLHDIAKPKTLRIAKGKVSFYGHERLGASMIANAVLRLRLSNEEVRCLKQIVLYHLRSGYLAASPALTARAKFRFFRDTSSEAVSVLLLSLADQRATRGYLTVERTRHRHQRLAHNLIREYFLNKKYKKPVRILNGNDLLRHFKLEPSALIGKLLAELDELQAIGKVKDKKDAFMAASGLMVKYGRQKQ